uniref:RNA-directed RNA polymerase n=1 Tax=Skunk River virus TaxID=2488682 RepID=A0A3Q8RRR0_9REOV|nr:VP1 [Skunk River virus]
MAAVTQDAEHVRQTLRKLFLGLEINGQKTDYHYYKYSPALSEKFEREGKRKKCNGENEATQDDAINDRTVLYGVPVIREATWEDIALDYQDYSADGTDALRVYEMSLLPMSELDPEEEFLRNYELSDPPRNVSFDKFIRQRMRAECAVYGDLSLRHWYALLTGLDRILGTRSLGLGVITTFIMKYGIPFKQNTRDLSQISEEIVSSTVVLLFEMCLMESILEMNVRLRCEEEKIKNEIRVGTITVNMVQIIRELFLVMLPHPKKINNGLRAVYSWFVKCWGTGCEEVIVLESRGSDDRNSKDVNYVRYKSVQNAYAQLVNTSRFHSDSRRANLKKLEDTLLYAEELSGRRMSMPVFHDLLRHVYTAPFDPTNIGHVVLASLLLSIQTMSGYGRAWVKNVGDDPEKIVQPSESNFISRVCKQTEVNFIRAYDEAEKRGFRIVPPHEMYSSLLRLAKNTSSGMSTTVEVIKTFGPRSEYKEDVIKISSRQKAMVIMREGDKIYSDENLRRKFNTSEWFQTKGSRDVPIKSTRTIYAIHISVLAPQLLLTLPLNEYFAQAGGATTPSAPEIAGKIIIGDLEATGSRVMDASDTYRNTSDESILTLALDYSEYDSHMTAYNFRAGMLSGMRRALSKYHSYRYEGYTVDDMIEFGYGDGRISGTLWNGKRAVFRMWEKDYLQLNKGDIEPPEDAAFKIRTPGVFPIRSLEIASKYASKDGDILVSPWDGSDLAKVSTHLSGENSTLIANSLHNMAIGRIMQEELACRAPGVLNILSEMYVGDDTLFYIATNTNSVSKIDRAIDVIFDTVKKCGHEASAAKTTFLPFSAEKTQTHAKQGIYIPQDRMMVVSSEKPKNIENIQGYMRANVTTYVTKVSRGFSERLARLILMFKASILGYRKLKRTVFDGEYRSRKYHSHIEDGYTLCTVRDPMVLFLPIDWNGYGASPVALNIVNTPELILDMIMIPELTPFAYPLLRLRSMALPVWDETKADKRQIKTETPMALFSKLARPAVVAALSNSYLSSAVRELPLQGLGPHQISKTMLHSALLKEQRARTLLSPGYELDYQKELNKHRANPSIRLSILGEDMAIDAGYAKMFTVRMDAETQSTYVFPDVNLSPSFKMQKYLLGNRNMLKIRMSYVDKIDGILRGDVVMRGFVTSTMILRLLEELGTGHTVEDLSTIFQLMNIESRIAQRLAEYVGRSRIRFDTLKVNKGGIAGDEFSMSLNVCTQEMVDSYVSYPWELQQAERDALVLHASQLLMIRASVGLPPCRLHFEVHPEWKNQVRKARITSRMPPRGKITKLCSDVRNLVATMIERQFL